MDDTVIGPMWQTVNSKIKYSNVTVDILVHKKNCKNTQDRATQLKLSDYLWFEKEEFFHCTYFKKFGSSDQFSLKKWKPCFDRYDLPAMLSHVMAVTGAERFHYIGHSMGTLSYYTACNYHPWIGRQFSSSFLLPFLLLFMRVWWVKSTVLQYLSGPANQL